MKEIVVAPRFYMNHLRFYTLPLLLALWGFVGCSDPSSPACQDDLDPTRYTTTLTGQVRLENQAEHSNALVYISGLHRGAGSDSSGYYSFQFDPCDTDTSGIFTLYYYLEDYDLDTARIKLEHGWVQLDTLDVNSSGTLPLVEMNQLYRLQGWTDTQSYRIGDSLFLTARWTNVSDSTLALVIPDADSNELGWMRLIRDANYLPYSLITRRDSLVHLDRGVYLPPGSFYEGKRGGVVPEGTYYYASLGDTARSFSPLEPAEYVVVPAFRWAEYNGLRRNVPYKVYWFIWHNWEPMHRGSSPVYPHEPHKFELPRVEITE